MCASFDIPIDICGETLLIDCRLAADVRVGRRCRTVCSVGVDRCRSDVVVEREVRLLGQFFAKKFVVRTVC